METKLAPRRGIMSASSKDEADRTRKALHLDLITAKTEQDRAMIRCAMNLLNGAEPYEIDPVTGVSHTVAGFDRAAQSWINHYAEYDQRDDGDFWRHDIVQEWRAIQAHYAAVHPELAEFVAFPGHGPATCVFCLMEANEAAGLPVETGMDPVTGRVAQPVGSR